MPDFGALETRQDMCPITRRTAASKQVEGRKALQTSSIPSDKTFLYAPSLSTLPLTP